MATSVADYEALITSEHNQRPNYMAMIDATTQGAVDSQNLLSTFSSLFDVDLAVGQQLDMVGTWVGATRDLTIALPPTGITQLTDGDFRTLLYAVIAANFWTGNVPGIYDIWATVFATNPVTVLVQDNQDMTMFVVLVTNFFSNVVLALIVNGYFNLCPAGVNFLGFYQPSAANEPVFGLGVNNSTIGGLGYGYIVEPITI